jgi:hypothetical protein|tara:strand:+ start:1319 stop:2254 length:936 start_codon:yes stop_codon:yes gene_type:complete
MKHIEDTPWWICDKDDENYCAYVDTDSNYFNAEPILKHLHPDFEEFNDKDKDSILEKVALKYQDIINDDYDRLAREAFNVIDHRLEMKTECVIRSAYFRATRRYAQWITKQEGIEKEQLDIKGLEFMKANFPPILGEFFNSILRQVLKGGEKAPILDQIKVFKKQILGGEIPLTKLGNPTSVKKLDKYSGTKARAGEMFTEILKGAPAPVRAAVRYNDLLKLWSLDRKHNLITQSDKVKWIYLKDNPYKIEALAFFDYDMPDKIQSFLDIYADRQKVFESILLNKLEGFFNDLEWSLDLNPHLNALSSFDI